MFKLICALTLKMPKNQGIKYVCTMIVSIISVTVSKYVHLFMSSAEYSCKLFKPIFCIQANSVDPDQTAPDLGPHCLQK